MDMIMDLHGPDYEFYQTFCEPADVGFSATARRRTYVIGAHNEKTTVLKDPLELCELISTTIRKTAYTLPHDYLVATATEVQLEAQELALRRRRPYAPGCCDLRYLLTDRERQALRDYCNYYWQKYGQNPHEQDSLFVHLGDNPDFSLNWSARGRLPTFRMNGGLLWSVKYNRWLTAKERLVSMGWPVVNEVAEGMAAPLIPATDVKRASDLLGNSMHFLNTGVQQMVALSCFGPDCRSSMSF